MFSGFGTVSNDTCVTMGIFLEMVTLLNMYAYKCNQPSTSAREQKDEENESKEFIDFCKTLKMSWVNPYSSPTDLVAVEIRD